MKPPPTSYFVKKAMGIFIDLYRCLGKDKCVIYPGHLFGDMVSVKYMYEIAKLKHEVDPLLKHHKLESVMKMCCAQLRSMGVGLSPHSEKPPAIKLVYKI